MGFSLSRALAGGVVGAAGAAGQVFDAQLKEAAIDRARVADEERAFRVADHADELAAMREQRKYDFLAGKEEATIAKDAATMREVRAKVREQGLDPDTPKGMKAAAGFAEEAGYLKHANTFRTRAEVERHNTAQEEATKENRAARLQAASEARANRKLAGMDAEDKAAMNGIIRQADRLVIPGARDENGKVVGDPDKDAANAAISWAESERDKGRSWKAIRSDLAQITEGFVRQPDEIKKTPSINRFSAALDFWNLPEDKRAAFGKKVAPVVETGKAAAPVTTSKRPDSAGGIVGWFGRQLGGSDAGANTDVLMGD